MDKITTLRLSEMKRQGEKIAMLTAYDFTMASILSEASVDVILVGDSLGMVKLGYENTLPVTMDDIVRHCQAVSRAKPQALLLADMPFLSYEAGSESAVLNAGRLVKEGGAQGVKIEGGAEFVPVIEKIVRARIPVMGHIGLTPQAVHQLGGYKVQGRSDETAEKLIASAQALERAGVFSLVLECIPADLAREITSLLSIPTISIGAGPFCDGQVLVLDDLLGLYTGMRPRFVKRYLDLRPQIIDAVRTYCREVKEGLYPSEEHSYK